MAKFCCKNCKYWEVSTPPSKDKLRFGSCKKGESSGGNPTVADTLMYASDFEGYGANLKTSSGFRCSMFKGKGGSDD